MNEYERRFRKGSRVTTLGRNPTLGTVRAIFRSRDAEGYRYRAAEVRWDDGAITTTATANLVAARDVA